MTPKASLQTKIYYAQRSLCMFSWEEGGGVIEFWILDMQIGG